MKQNIAGKNKSTDKVIGIYTSFAGIDYLEAVDLLDQIEKGVEPKVMELDTIYSSFGDQTIFSLLFEKRRALELIYYTVGEQDYEEIEDFYGKSETNPDLRRLTSIILKNNVIAKKLSDTTQKSYIKMMSDLMYYLPQEKMAVSRDIILRIGSISPDFSIF